jgi:hypothetical protein
LRALLATWAEIEVVGEATNGAEAVRLVLEFHTRDVPDPKVKLDFTVSCPTAPSAIGIDMARFKDSYMLARTIRSRYTVLDLASETGVLDACVDELFAPGGFWFRASAVQAEMREAGSGAG